MKPRRILIADDNKDLADGLAMILEDEGYSVEVSYRGDDAVAQLSAKEFDVVFLDIKMPDLDGVEIFQRFSEAKNDTTFLLMTGYRIEQVLTNICSSKGASVFRYSVRSESMLQDIERNSKHDVVLVVDSTADFNKTMIQYCSSMENNALVVSSYQEALTAAETHAADITLLDFSKPLIFSFGACFSIQEQVDNPPNIVIVVHADGEVSADPLRQLEVTGCLFKPFNPANVLQFLEKL